ncbi:MAG: alkaline phosphatase D family protein [Catalinimonas sp.]
MRTLLPLLFLLTLPAAAQRLGPTLQSGPMVGYSEMREVALWVQTTAPATVRFEYYEADRPGTRYRTADYRTRREEGHTATLIADQVLPGKRYRYELFIDNRRRTCDYPLEFQSQPLWQYRTDPPAFTFALGSCHYVNEEAYDRPGEGYGGGYEIFGTIHEARPDFMVWLGDNTYLRNADWNTRTGVYHRYTHTRSLPEVQPLLASTHHYAIWDDHDYGPNDSDRSFAQKEITYEAFRDFWPNLNWDVTGTGGITGHFQWADVEFFLLDDRYHRTPNNREAADRDLLGEAQIEWLIDALVSSQAPFKFVCIGGQVLNPAAVYENYATYPEERADLLRLIRENDIPGVIFLNGDRHHSELTVLKRRGTYPLYDITCSPLTAGTHAPNNEGNYLQEENTLVSVRNFGLLTVSGPRRDRQLQIRILDANGGEQWSRTIKASDLR